MAWIRHRDRRYQPFEFSGRSKCSGIASSPPPSSTAFCTTPSPSTSAATPTVSRKSSRPASSAQLPTTTLNPVGKFELPQVGNLEMPLTSGSTAPPRRCTSPVVPACRRPVLHATPCPGPATSSAIPWPSTPSCTPASSSSCTSAWLVCSSRQPTSPHHHRPTGGVVQQSLTMTETAGHVTETLGHDDPKPASVTFARNDRSRCRNRRSRWAEIRTSSPVSTR